MHLRKLLNLSFGSGNPSSLTNLLPGGAGSQVAGSTPNPMIASPRIEQMAQEVFDVTASGTTPTPAAAGKLLVFDATVTGSNLGQGGASFRQSAAATAPYGQNKAGIVAIPGQASEATAAGGTSNGTKATIIVDGPVLAYCTTTATAITLGCALAADGAGNLTYNAGTVAGVVLAIAAGTLPASTATPTLVPVIMGGY